MGIKGSGLAAYAVCAAAGSALAWQAAHALALESMQNAGRQTAMELAAGWAQGPGRQWQGSPQEAARSLAGANFDYAVLSGPDGKEIAHWPAEYSGGLELADPARVDLAKSRYAGETQASETVSLGSASAVWTRVPLRGAGGELAGSAQAARVIRPWEAEREQGAARLAGWAAALSAAGGALMALPFFWGAARRGRKSASSGMASQMSMLEAFGRAIARRDSDSGAHNYRVAWMACVLAELMDYPQEGMPALMAGSFLHDAGKIGIPDELLLKPGKLTQKEFEVMKTHVGIGERMVMGEGWLAGAREIVACHHEKWDGSGYPNGLSGEGIPLGARIFAVADVFDALCSRRPFKMPMRPDDALAIIVEQAGSHFDPKVVSAFAPEALEMHRLIGQASEEQARMMMRERMEDWLGKGGMGGEA